MPGISKAQDQDTTPLAPSLRQDGEIYRLRVQNETLGRVEVSTDGGIQWMQLGRVLHPAVGATTERTEAATGAVLRAGKEGWAFAVGPHQILKLRPYENGGSNSTSHPLLHKPHATASPPLAAYDIGTSIGSGTGIFGDLAANPGSLVRLQTRNGLLAFGAQHVVSDQDQYVFIARLPVPADKSIDLDQWRETIRDRFAKISEAYASSAITRARAAGRSVVSGIITLKAKLPTGEPDPIAAVTYQLDDTLLGAQNVGPFSFDWDTRRCSNGEHVVDITALNRNGRRITYARALVVVDNRSGTETDPNHAVRTSP